MKVSPHNHPESVLTGSSLSSLIARAKDLGRTHYAITDNGHLSSAVKAYTAAKKANLKPILGMEVYFKDSNCPFITGKKGDRAKYFTLSIYAKDQEAYQAICKVASKTNLPTFYTYEEDKQLWGWNELNELSKFNISVVLGGVHDIVAKNFLAGDGQSAKAVFENLINIFGPEKLNVAMLCEPWSKKYESVIKVEFTDNTSVSFLSSSRVTTDKARKIKAMDLIDRQGHTFLKSYQTGNDFNSVNKDIKEVTIHKGFLPLGIDASLAANKVLRGLAKLHNVRVLATDYAYYSNADDKIVQTMVSGTKLAPNLHMKTEEEFRNYLSNTMNLSQSEVDEIVANNGLWADEFNDFNLKYDWRLAEVEGDSTKIIMDIIKKNGRMEWSNPIHTARLKEELNVIIKNGKKDVGPYFLPVHDILNHYKENGQLTGPGRGSSAGSFLAYLMGITQVNPFKYNLSFSRFYSIDRIQNNMLADIDSDVEDRELFVGKDKKSGYLYSRWGNKAAQISTRQRVRLKSAIKDVNRYVHGSVEPEIEVLSKALPSAPQGVPDDKFIFGYEDEDENHVPGLLEQSDALQKYAIDRPKEWELVQKMIGLTRSFGSHASAFVIADRPISEIAPTKDGHITQYEAKEAEFAGLVKIDMLVITQLKDIRVCMDYINKKNGDKFVVGNFRHKGKETYIWDLPEDLDVYKSIWNGETESFWQINTAGMSAYVPTMRPKSIEDLSLVLSLQRPGPLDAKWKDTGRNMAQEFVHRRFGGEYEDIPVLKELIPETYSILIFQEQVTKIAKELAGFDGLEAENLRAAIGKKNQDALNKMGPKFKAGCLSSGRISQEDVEVLWDRTVTFGNYSFNLSHGISYAFITYACMFLAHHYRLEWWAAVLSNASEKEISGKFWPIVKDLVAPPDINLSTDEMVIDYANEKLRAKFGVLKGMGDASIDPIVENRPYKDIQDFVNKRVAGPTLSHKLIHVGILDSLFPPKSNLIQKLQAYEDAIEIRNYNEKVEKAKKEGKKIKATEPKKGVLPEQYLNLLPFQDAAMKKAVLPSITLSLHHLGQMYSKRKVKGTQNYVLNEREKRTALISPDQFDEIFDMPKEEVVKTTYFAVTCYVIECKEFSYGGGSKRALKLNLDAGNGGRECVVWPSYGTTKPDYPEGLKKGQIITAYFIKKAESTRSEPAIIEIVIES